MSQYIQKDQEEIPYTLGEILHYERERRRFTIEKVASELKIRKSYVENLEKGRYAELPADIYTRNYVKRYAKLLKLDHVPLLELFQRERQMKLGAQNNDPTRPFSEKKKTFSFVVTPKIIRRIAIALIAISFVLYMWYQISDLSSAPDIIIVEPAANETTIETNEITLIGETSPDATLSINGEQKGINSDGTFQEKILLQSGLNIIIIEAENKLGKKEEVQRKVFVE